MKTAPLLFVLAVLTAAIDTGYGYVPSPEDVKGVGSLGKGLVKGDDITQYGNWYGPGWWGGDRKATAGGKPPVDEMDAAAQRHDFGYQEAERMGKIYGKAEERRLKAIADAICTQDAQRLDPDPSKWNPPAADPEKASRYRDRMVTWFTHEQDVYDAAAKIGLGADWVTSPIENWELDRSQQLTRADLEKNVNRLIKDWNKKNPPEAPKADEPASGGAKNEPNTSDGGKKDDTTTGDKETTGKTGDAPAADGKTGDSAAGDKEPVDEGTAGTGVQPDGGDGGGADPDAGKVSNEAGAKVGADGYQEGDTVVDKNGKEFVNKDGTWTPTGEDFGKVDGKTKDKWDKELNGDGKDKNGDGKDKAGDGGDKEGADGEDENLAGNEPELGDGGGDDKDGNTAVADFTKGVTKTQGDKVSSGFDGMDANGDLTDATQTGSDADDNAQNTINQGGAAAGKIKNDSATDVASADKKNSWSSKLGDGLADGIEQGADAFGAAVGQGAAKETLKKNKKHHPPKSGDDSGDGNAPGDDGVEPDDTPVPPDGAAADSGVKTTGGSKKEGGGKNSGNKSGKNDGNKDGKKKDTSTKDTGDKITVNTTGDASDSSSGGYAAGPQDKVISVGGKLAGKRVTGCRVRVTYDAFSIPDTFQVVYDNGVIASSGSTSYGGSITAKGKGSTPRVTIRVISSSDQGTSWNWSATATFFVEDVKAAPPVGGAGQTGKKKTGGTL